MRDQIIGFTRVREVIPASWTIEADGRPSSLPEKPQYANDEEDAICMVCFDGISSVGNEILFCDGCDMSVHQVKLGCVCTYKTLR